MTERVPERRQYGRSMSRPRVIVVRDPDGELPSQLRALDELADVVAVATEDAFRRACRDAEIAFLWDFDTDLLRRTGPGSLKWIHTNSVGLDAVLTPAVADSPVVVTNTRGVFETPMAEWVLAVLLFFAKGLARTVDSQRAARWDYRLLEPVNGRRALIIGAGPVGRAIAHLLGQVGYLVRVVGRSERPDAELGQVCAIDRLDDLLAGGAE